MTAARRELKDRRREELRRAILKLKNCGQRISITAVAREVGVTPALLHNTYPDIAEEIRSLQGKNSRYQRDAAREEVARLRAENGKLREEKDRAEHQARQLASMLEAMRHELARVRAVAEGKLVPMKGTTRP